LLITVELSILVESGCDGKKHTALRTVLPWQIWSRRVHRGCRVTQGERALGVRRAPAFFCLYLDAPGGARCRQNPIWTSFRSFLSVSGRPSWCDIQTKMFAAIILSVSGRPSWCETQTKSHFCLYLAPRRCEIQTKPDTDKFCLYLAPAPKFCLYLAPHSSHGAITVRPHAVKKWALWDTSHAGRPRHRAVEAPEGLRACFEPLLLTSSPAVSMVHFYLLSTPRLDKFCEPMGWPPAQPSFSGAPSPTVRSDRESTNSPLLLATARAVLFRSPRTCCRR
jgi:hypothetical protein